MLSQTFFTFILCLFGASIVSSSDTSWDYSVLVQEWPTTSCMKYRSRGCEVPSFVEYFTIHGLWPNRNDGGYPADCPGEPFNEQKLQPILATLNRYWVSFLGPNTDFWTHEWSKHGTCFLYGNTTQYRTQIEYFQVVLDLYMQRNITGFLYNSGLKPSFNVKYSVDSITSKLQAYIGKKPAVHCFEHKYLLGIWQCVDKNMNLIDCPDNLTHNSDKCSDPSGVEIPPLAN